MQSTEGGLGLGLGLRLGLVGTRGNPPRVTHSLRAGYLGGESLLAG